jgi:hypothetical protein
MNTMSYMVCLLHVQVSAGRRDKITRGGVGAAGFVARRQGPGELNRTCRCVSASPPPQTCGKDVAKPMLPPAHGVPERALLLLRWARCCSHSPSLHLLLPTSTPVFLRENTN